MRSTSSNADLRSEGVTRSLPPIDVHPLRRLDYPSAWGWQRALVDARGGELDVDQLLLVEHEPVVTVGRGAQLADAAEVPFPVVEIERGGEVTYHGPGQLVGYPIVKLGEGERDLHRYLRSLEELLIGALARLGVLAVRHPPHTGVWLATAAGMRKVASIGVAVRRWVTYHGFALNVATDLAAFRQFQPCGLSPTVMTSLHAEGYDLAIDDVATAVISELPTALRREARVVDSNDQEPIPSSGSDALRCPPS